MLQYKKVRYIFSNQSLKYSNWYSICNLLARFEALYVCIYVKLEQYD